LTSWGPRVRIERIHDKAGVLQNNNISMGVGAQLAANITADVTVNRDLERYQNIDFRPREVTLNGNVDMSRLISVRGQFTKGRAIKLVEDPLTETPFLGDSTEMNLTVNLRPASRARSEITLTTSRLVDPRTGLEEFDVRIFRALTSYQFTNRLVLRNITELDTSDRTLGLNLLATYRVNAGTALFVGYDDHYAEQAFETQSLAWRRSNRAIFAKLQVLLRY
jgi:hypothetical protein